uniref:Developmental pluripotency-associated protein 3 n=1 Tax=Peromyscus maniculatus bairdii TaxID=230844 RepID=A0A8C8UL96_PERMB|nr:developmental pluripotency-associated protein 3-like [Peromyscus maniculatus bairdii]
MEETSEMFEQVLNSGPPESSDDQDSCDDSVSQSEMLVKDLKKLTFNPSAEKSPSLQPVRYRRRQHCRPRPKMRVVENNSEKILRAVQSAFPKRRVCMLLSVQKDPVARMKRFMWIEKTLRSRNGERDESEPFRCLCTFCLYEGWGPAENAKIVQN